MFSSSRSIHSGARLVRGVRAPLIVSCSSLSEVTPAPIVMTDRTNVRVFLGGGGYRSGNLSGSVGPQHTSPRSQTHNGTVRTRARLIKEDKRCAVGRGFITVWTGSRGRLCEDVAAARVEPRARLVRRILSIP